MGNGKGFSGVNTLQDFVFADNASFDGTQRGGGLTTNGQLWIGHTTADRPDDSGHVKVGQITSPLGTISVGYSSPNITVDLTGGSSAIERVALQAGTTPVVPSGGTLTFNGAVVAAGTNPVRTNGTGANTMALQVQTSQALAATDATKIGLANFNSAHFSVDANGFVAATGAVAIQYTTDSGTATPSAGNLNILGGPGVVVSGSGSTVTINAVQFTDRAVSVSMTNDSGAFVTAAGVTLTTPASPTQGVELYIVATTADTVIVDAASTHLIRIGSLVTSAGGTATSTAIGDCLVLRWHNASSTWIATSVIGTWLVA